MSEPAYLYLITRHLPEPQEQFAVSSNLPGRPESTFIPSGAMLQRPWPEAVIRFIEVGADRFYYVHWVDSRLTVAEGNTQWDTLRQL